MEGIKDDLISPFCSAIIILQTYKSSGTIKAVAYRSLLMVTSGPEILSVPRAVTHSLSMCVYAHNINSGFYSLSSSSCTSQFDSFNNTLKISMWQ